MENGLRQASGPVHAKHPIRYKHYSEESINYVQNFVFQRFNLFFSGQYGVQSFGAAAFFGFVTMAVYAYDAFVKFMGWRAGQLAQGQRVVQQTETANNY